MGMAGAGRRRYAQRGRLGQDGSDLSQYDLAGQTLRAINQRLKALEGSLASNPDIAQQIGAQVIKARQRYTDLLQAYIYAYGVAFGPPDTTGLQLGQWQLYVVAGIGIAAILAAAYELDRYISAVENQARSALVQSQASAQQQQTLLSLQQQLLQAQATGDTVKSGQILNAMKAVGASGPAAAGSQTFMDFVSQNAGLLAVGAAALFIGIPLLEGR
jgi:hypothetical protein